SGKTSYMSQEGSLRLKVHEETGKWITLDESHAFLLQAAPTVFGGKKDQEWKTLVELARSMPDGKTSAPVPAVPATPPAEPEPAEPEPVAPPAQTRPVAPPPPS